MKFLSYILSIILFINVFYLPNLEAKSAKDISKSLHCEYENSGANKSSDEVCAHHKKETESKKSCCSKDKAPCEDSGCDCKCCFHGMMMQPLLLEKIIFEFPLAIHNIQYAVGMYLLKKKGEADRMRRD